MQDQSLGHQLLKNYKRQDDDDIIAFLIDRGIVQESIFDDKNKE